MNTTLKKRTNKKSEDGLKKGDNPKTYIDDVVVRRHSDFCPLGMNLLQSVKPRCQMVLSRTFKQKIKLVVVVVVSGLVVHSEFSVFTLAWTKVNTIDSVSVLSPEYMTVICKALCPVIRFVYSAFLHGDRHGWENQEINIQIG